jgi:hypothetical protein
MSGGPNTPPSTITWSSSAPLVARVNARTGRVVALREGSATITGSANGTTASITLHVIPGKVVLAGKVAVAQLITTDVKSTLHAGDTVRITAAPLDEKGASLLDRKVTWQSTHPEIASVDGFGLVTAHAPGTTDIVATSEQQSARIPVTVGTRSVAFSDANSALRSGTDRFISAVTAHDTRRITASMVVESADDQKTLDWLLGKARSATANLHVTRAQTSRPNVRDAEATAEVGFTFAWTAPNGQLRETRASFRARSTRGSDGWSPATFKAIDKLE